MKPAIRSLSLSLVIVGCCLAAHAAADGGTQVPAPKRNALREAVEAHRAERRDEVRREEAAMGRHLSPAELAELRAQLRQQWVPPVRRVASAQLQAGEPIASAPVPSHATVSSAQASERSSALLVPAARSQRP